VRGKTFFEEVLWVVQVRRGVQSAEIFLLRNPIQESGLMLFSGDNKE
jgi:hypothetical protein